MNPKEIDALLVVYTPLVKSLARKYIGRNGAEFDDLVQEGLIDVWTTLKRGRLPSVEYIKLRMNRYCKYLNKYNHASYDEIFSEK